MSKEVKNPRGKALKRAAEELDAARQCISDEQRAAVHVEIARAWLAVALAHAPQADGSYDR